MRTANTRFSAPEREGSILGNLMLGLLYFLWYVIRTPIVLFLIIIEPFVYLLLGGVAVLGVVTAIVWETSSYAAKFPFWGMIGFSFGCLLLLALYHGLIRLLSR